MDVCKCIVPSQHGGTINGRRATSPLERLVKGEKRWEAPGIGYNRVENGTRSPLKAKPWARAHLPDDLRRP
ncbi:hypothetical protein TNCV_264761 [Trichonephila clavipes]|nr:hypothetical protein TNCV_264761 [Trichonephila clavipes]